MIKRSAALLMLIIALSGCTLPSTIPATANPDHVTEEIATIQPTYPPTITPPATATRTPHPTNTPRPTPTSTASPTTPTATEAETADETKTGALSTASDEAESSPAETIIDPTAAANNNTLVPVSSGQYSGHLANIGPHLKTIYARGQQLGNNPRAFSKIGDCEAAFPTFLQDFDKGTYDLADYEYLEVVLKHFTGSFKHVGEAADGGMSSTALLNAFWANPDTCEAGETPLACEYRTHKPSIALIMVRTIDINAVENGQYHNELTSIVQYTLDQGIIPVLSTIPYWGPQNPDTALINDTIRQVAAEKNVPLWDFWVTSEQLPNRGVTQDYHIADPAYQRATFFDADSLRMGVTRRNLEALEVLHAVLAQVNKN